LIRYYFKKNPGKLSVNKWAQLYQEAVWLSFFEMKKQAEVLSSILGK